MTEVHDRGHVEPPPPFLSPQKASTKHQDQQLDVSQVNSSSQDSGPLFAEDDSESSLVGSQSSADMVVAVGNRTLGKEVEDGEGVESKTTDHPKSKLQMSCKEGSESKGHQDDVVENGTSEKEGNSKRPTVDVTLNSKESDCAGKTNGKEASSCHSSRVSQSSPSNCKRNSQDESMDTDSVNEGAAGNSENGDSNLADSVSNKQDVKPKQEPKVEEHNDDKKEVMAKIPNIPKKEENGKVEVKEEKHDPQSVKQETKEIPLRESKAEPKIEEEDDTECTSDKSEARKRLLPSTESVSLPDNGPKRFKLADTIGRLSSYVGKKPEELESMEEELDSTSESGEESSSDGEKITLTVKELNRIIRKRMEMYIAGTQAVTQKVIVELQAKVESWRSQAKQFETQLTELAKVESRSKVQAAAYQKGVNASAGKSAAAAAAAAAGSPRAGTPSTPPVRPPLLPAGVPTAITVKNAQIRTNAPNRGGAVGTVPTVRQQTPPRPRPAATVTTKDLGSCIDLTDDDEKAPAATTVTKSATAKSGMTTPVRSVVGTNAIFTPTGAAALKSGAVIFKGTPTSLGGPLVLQPVTQAIRLSAQQGALMMAATRAPGGVRPVATAAAVKPGQILLQPRITTTAVTRPPPPLKSVPSLKHPAPLPPCPANAGTYPKQAPPKPTLKISRVQQGIVLSWNMTVGDAHADISNYQLFAYQETHAPPTTNLWKRVGDVKALPLPMACTLTQFQEGNKYHFAVRAIDSYRRIGPFSDACSIQLSSSSS